MKIFSDNKLKKQLDIIHFGTVEATETKELVIYVNNDSTAVLEDLQFIFGNLPKTETLEIINAPKTMQPNTTETMKIKWTPSLNFKQALELQLSITGKEVYYAAV